MFESTGPHHCPVCPPVLNKRQRRIDRPLQLVVRNYSGCSVDIAQCPECQRRFQISYKVDEIRDIEKDLQAAAESRPAQG